MMIMEDMMFHVGVVVWVVVEIVMVLIGKIGIAAEAMG